MNESRDDELVEGFSVAHDLRFFIGSEEIFAYNAECSRLTESGVGEEASRSQARAPAVHLISERPATRQRSAIRLSLVCLPWQIARISVSKRLPKSPPTLSI